MVGCASGIHAVGGPGSLPPSATLAFREHFEPVVAKLNARRAAAGRALRRAGHARGQRAAAQRIAAAHRSAAAALAPLAPGRGAERAAVQRLNATAGAYHALARAAGRRDRRGYGRACLTGLAHVSSPDVVVFLDGDYSDRPAELPRLLAPIDMSTGLLPRGCRGRSRSEILPGNFTGGSPASISRASSRELIKSPSTTRTAVSVIPSRMKAR